MIIFDVDGVLVDVRGSFHTTVLQTVSHFTKKKVTRHELHQWKNRSGFNDDWKLSTAWVQSLGGKNEYDETQSPDIDALTLGRDWIVAHGREREPVARLQEPEETAHGDEQ